MKEILKPAVIVLSFIGLLFLCSLMSGSYRLPSTLTQEAHSAETLYAKVTADIELVDIELTKLAYEPVTTPIPTPSIDSQNWPGNFLHNPICQIPCWENITPSQTDINTAKRIIASISGVRVIYLKSNEIGWYFSDESGRNGVVFANQDGIVTKIDLMLNDDEAINLGNAIKSFGNPQAILEAYDCGFILSYPYQGMLLLTQDVDYCNRKSVDLAPTTQINRIVLFSLDRKDDILGNFAFKGEILWDGYKIYDFTNK